MQSDESGASLALVTVTIFALFGMAMLAIDVGGIVVARRQMVRAADSSALAAAQSCATNNPGEAETKADEFAVANHNGADTSGDNIVNVTGVCGGSSDGTVTTRYEAFQDLYFAPVLGLDDETTVPGRATAMWAPANQAGVLPIEITLGDAANGFPCIDFQNIDADHTCNYYFDNSADHDLADDSNWGWINFNTWPVDEAENVARVADPGSVKCPNSGSDLKDWIEPWITGDETKKYKAKVYGTGSMVCVNDGKSLAGLYGALLEQLEGRDVFFPVNDPAQMYPGHPGLYAIVGFAPMHIEQVLRGFEASGQEAGGAECPRFQVAFDGPGDTFAAGAEVAECSATNDADTITGPALYDDRGKAIKASSYNYDPTTAEITWIGNKGKADDDDAITADVAFTWSRGAEAGPCGVHKRDPNAICIVARWGGPQIGGGEPVPGTRDFGLRAIRLIKTDIS
jgi:hypothetical protein